MSKPAVQTPPMKPRMSASLDHGRCRDGAAASSDAPWCGEVAWCGDGGSAPSAICARTAPAADVTRGGVVVGARARTTTGGGVVLPHGDWASGLEPDNELDDSDCASGFEPDLGSG